MHFRSSLLNPGKLANTPSKEKNKLQPGPSPAFSAVASSQWCSTRQGLPGLQRGGTLGRGVRELTTQVDVRVDGGRKRARRCRRRQWRSGRRRCRRRKARGRRTSRTRTPREREEAPGVAVVLGLPRIWPVRGEPRARRQRRGRGTATGVVFVGFSARVSFTGVL